VSGNVVGSPARAPMPRHPTKPTKYCDVHGCANPYYGDGSRCPVHAGTQQPGFKARRDRRLGRLGEAR
jgi:hypothetical protein